MISHLSYHRMVYLYSSLMLQKRTQKKSFKFVTKLNSTISTYSSRQDGSAFAIEPSTTSIGGKIACKPRAITVFAVPRLPEIAIPPISRSVAPSNKALLIASFKKTAGITISKSSRQKFSNNHKMQQFDSVRFFYARTQSKTTDPFTSISCISSIVPKPKQESTTTGPTEQQEQGST